MENHDMSYFPEQYIFLFIFCNKIDIFQCVEDSDLFVTRQILQVNESLVNS